MLPPLAQGFCIPSAAIRAVNIAVVISLTLISTLPLGL
jgi:hypothetical protein